MVPPKNPVAGTVSPTHFRSILQTDLRLHCNGWTVHEILVDRHLQPFDLKIPHSHPHGQILLYLRGRGDQRIGRKCYQVSPGSVFFVPPGTEHFFFEHAPRLAICFVVNLTFSEPARFGRAAGLVKAEELNRIRETLNELHGDQAAGAPKSAMAGVGASGRVLLLLEACLQALFSTPALPAQKVAITTRLLRTFDAGGLPPSPAEMSRRIGLQKDHLNRLMRKATGLTLGQWRSRELLKLCKIELGKRRKVAETAACLGFADANYFSRWFRNQTGMTPASWLNR